MHCFDKLKQQQWPKPPIISGDKDTPTNRLHIIAHKLANITCDIIMKKKIPDIELKIIQANIQDIFNIKFEGLNVKNSEETHTEGQIETSCYNHSGVHKQIVEDNDKYERKKKGDKKQSI